MAEALLEGAWPRPGLPLEPAAIQAGLAAARWPGRLELRHFRGHPLLLDGAHNPPAAAVLRHELDRLAPGPRRWLIGIQRHKDGPAILERLLGPLDRALVVPIPEHHCWSRVALADACPALAPQLEGAADAFVGLERLVTAAPTAGSSGAMAIDSCPVIAGSLHLLGLVIPWLDRPEPA
jgi:dihydrofolate synthase/folylpolyglutamate synthase